jgi:enolase
MKIVDIHAREIFDSRGVPTLECELSLDDGMTVVSSVPSGISRSMHEAYEMRDADERLQGLGVKKAVHVVENIIAPLFIGRAPSLITMDTDMIECDDTENKSKLGANAMLAVSIAVCKAQAYYEAIPVYELIAELCGQETIALPCPMFNLIEGGLHAFNKSMVQEFLVVPVTQMSFHDAMNVGVSVFYELQNLLKTKNIFFGYGYEGGCAPLLENSMQALDLLMEAIERSHNSKNVMLALDVAASQFYSVETGLYTWEGKMVTADYMIDWYKQLIDTYPIYSIEDGLSEVDWHNWQKMKAEFGGRVKVVGDDLFATNSQRIWDGIERDVATTAIIKPNQIGTLTEALQAVNL